MYYDSGLNLTYGVETLILWALQKVPNFSHYKMMVLNLQISYLKGKLHHYKMKICFYHQVT